MGSLRIKPENQVDMLDLAELSVMIARPGRGCPRPPPGTADPGFSFEAAGSGSRKSSVLEHFPFRASLRSLALLYRHGRQR
jgi:hypothetical protein